MHVVASPSLPAEPVAQPELPSDRVKPAEYGSFHRASPDLVVSRFSVSEVTVGYAHGCDVAGFNEDLAAYGGWRFANHTRHKKPKLCQHRTMVPGNIKARVERKASESRTPGSAAGSAGTVDEGVSMMIPFLLSRRCSSSPDEADHGGAPIAIV